MPQDISFQCTKCRQWLEAPFDMVGLFIECPTCEAVIKVPPTSSVETAGTGTAKPQAKASTADEKGSTMRIHLPPNLGIPESPRRRFIIRRKT